MTHYVYGYNVVPDGAEVFFHFPRFPEIISSMPATEFDSSTAQDIREFLRNALVLALQSNIALKKDIPPSDNPHLTRADGFISLPVHQAMKLALYEIFRENCSSVAEFARQLGKTETLARRLLDLRHRSFSTEIENAVELFGKELAHDWRIERAPSHPLRQQPHRLRADAHV